MATALITGIAGQDGVYLARHLRARGLNVVGTVRSDLGATSVYLEGIKVLSHDIRDAPAFAVLLRSQHPTEVYNLAGFTSVGASWDQPDLVHEVNAVAVEAMLEELLNYRDESRRDVRFFQASSAEELGQASSSPYAVSKAAARRATANARDQHSLYACSGILHNHESPLRPARFVTRKITRAAAEISLGRRQRLSLGNLDVFRDWGAAQDHVRAMSAMLQLSEPQDLTIATGTCHSLENLLEIAFTAAGLSDPFSYVDWEPALIRPADSRQLEADTSLTRRLLGWAPEIGFEDLITRMVQVDRLRIESGVEETAAYLESAR